MSDKETPAVNRTKRKMEKTRIKIVETAMTLFRQQGIDTTTMEQIASEADIAKGTLYNYFPVKEAIIDAIMQQSFQKNSNERLKEIRSLTDTRQRATYIMTLLFEGVRDNQAFFEKYMVYRMQSLVSFQPDEGQKSGFRLLATEIIELGQKDGEVRKDLPPDILVDLFEFTFIEIVKQLALQPQGFNSRETIEHCIDLFMNGVKAK